MVPAKLVDKYPVRELLDVKGDCGADAHVVNIVKGANGKVYRHGIQAGVEVRKIFIEHGWGVVWGDPLQS